MVPLKRRKVASSQTGNTGNDTGSSTKFPHMVFFLLERKMGASRRAFLSQLGRNKGFQVEEVLSERVTHVVCENNSGEEVRAWLDSQTPAVDGAEVETFSVQIYACQRRMSLENRNAAITVRSSRFPCRRLGSVLKTS
ncbi:uncharacterized protein V6R79_002651 [Siganus canaliculatus]